VTVGPAAEQPADQADVLGRRIAAGLIDVGLLFALFIVLGVTIGESESSNGGGSVTLSGGAFLLYLGLVLLYYFVFEAATQATLGKLLLGLRVMNLAGGRPSAGSIGLRTVLRIVDWLPLLYVIGFIALLATGARRQRLGDLAAKTNVGRVAQG
jgi:uncharacterized RDD family membrane protein YckC